MATDNHINHFSAADIERYHKGLLSANERHALEKAALDDPFLADALEGFAVSGGNAAADLAELKNRLAQRTQDAAVIPIASTGRKRSSAMLRVAAMLVLIAGAGLLVYQFAFNKNNDNVAETREPKVVTTTQVPADSTIQPSSVAAGNTEKNASEKELKNIPNSPATGTKEKNNTITPAVDDDKTTDLNTRNTRIDPPVADIKTVNPGTTSPNQKSRVDDGTRQGGKGVETVTNKEEAKTRSFTKKNTERDEVKEDKIVQPVEANNERGIPAPRKNDEYTRNQAMNTFRGRVTDAANTGVPFANVTNVQDNVGTYTDANGNFTLTSPDSILEVQVRSLGYDNANTQLRNEPGSNRVVMQEDRRNLSEVVISNKKPNAAARSKDANRTLYEPEPKDGWEKYDSYLANNLNIPDDFKQQKTNTDNSVQLSFEVDKNGEPVNIRIEKSLCSSCDNEAIRLVKDGPKWKRNANKKGRTIVTINF